MDTNVERYQLALELRSRRILGRFGRFDTVSRQRLPNRGVWEILGSHSCGWLAPKQWAKARPVAYCVGAGEDISFDLALRTRHNADVYIFDPTPRAITHVMSTTEGGHGVTFRPWAVWSTDGTVELFEPRDPNHVSHSIVNLQSTAEAFEAPCRTVSSIMTEFGHSEIDLLKMDIEGAEYEVLGSILDEHLGIGIIEVEFDEVSARPPGWKKRLRTCLADMDSAGYQLAAVDMASNYTFVHRDYWQYIR
jgi:FkbM family methyltransferase